MYTEKQFCKDDNEEEHGTSSSDEVVDPYSCVDECDEEQSTTGTSILESHEHVVAFHSRHVFPQGASWVSGQFVIPRATTGVLSIRLENAATDSIASKRVELYVEVEPVKKQVTTDKLVAGWLALAIQEVGKQGSVDNDALAVNAVLPDGAAAASHDRIEQLEIAKSQADDQVSELTRRVVCLEDELENCKHDLRKTTEQLEIASEVQKANLETITRLEFPQQASAAAASEEHDRLKELCAQFQEQCLWRSIETSESEKRNMHLEAQVEALQAEIADLRDGNQQLRAQKSVLVQEVKRLQPFSQVNLSAIIQEAQEARMIQRSLQAQLLQLQQQQQQQQPCEDASTTDQSHGDLTVVDITHYAIPELQPEAERQPLEE
ncbi:TPA: hypothetical protein N0F65_008887 [Lagenidium giganteum]|uniref:Uncharacterized protein n=1 Tax=Lagenidium giganteum TaxID=4803 RepID=A0AAV2YYF7_9STRA|nr:TPA: hypothetical protein N0F65_008887 [Lagenidium giganteum]